MGQGPPPRPGRPPGGLAATHPLRPSPCPRPATHGRASHRRVWAWLDMTRLPTGWGVGATMPPEREAHVVPSEAHRIGQRDTRIDAPRVVGHVVQIAGRIALLVVDRRR